MKKYIEILKDYKKNAEEIKAKFEESEKLDFKEERHALFANEGYQGFKNEKYKELTAKAEANRDKINALYEEIYIDNVKCFILRANARHALFEEAAPIIRAALAKYQGKPYGERTAEKIREEVNKAGYGFYFNDYEITVYTLTPEGYKSHAEEAKAATMNNEHHTAGIVTKENKIDIDNIVFYPRDKYEENPTKAAKKAVKAIRNYTKATQEIREKADELRDILPAGIRKPDYISEYRVTF